MWLSMLPRRTGATAASWRCRPRTFRALRAKGGRNLGSLLPQVRVGACDPVGAGGGKDVEVERVFKGLRLMGHVGGNDQGLTCADGDDAAVAHSEAQSALEDVGDLLVLMAVLGHDRAF